MSFVASDSNREASLEVFSPSTATEWKIVRTLGEGTFASVKLAVNTSTNEALAIKITGYKTKESENEIKKEISIHKIMNHPNIVKFIGQKKFENSIYILLEYVNGGELFDRIEPNIGMPEETAKKYLVDIVNALTYIHKKGIVHRDIKPENCLVGSRNEIKITDFGLSTIYFYENKHRILQRFCGTHPYMAPEVFNKKDHLAEPIDVWSVGITFIALLSGQLPWKKPSTQIEGYKKFATKLHKFDEPWNKLSTESFNFIKKLLKIFPEKRWTLKNIIESEYLKQSLSKIDENAGTINNQNNRFKVMKIPVIINRDLLLYLKIIALD
ncbi:MAG: Serine/threonine-protein kinase Chk1 [Paramarteilia canceri]